VPPKRRKQPERYVQCPLNFFEFKNRKKVLTKVFIKDKNKNVEK
jgi:hypothetical protein